MDISLSAPLSGMTAAQSRMDNTAHNVANVNTRGFTAQRIEQVETANGRNAQTAASGIDIYESGTGTAVYNAGQAQPDLAQDMTNMITDRNTYAANADVVKVQNNMLGTAIDLVG